MARDSLDFRPPDRLSRALPHSLEAEQALLGIVLVSNSAFDRCSTVQPDHFHDPSHGRIWRTVVDLITKQALADLITVHERLKDDAGVQEIGGRTYLWDLFEKSPAVENVEEYASIVLDLSTKRRLVELAARVSEDVKGEQTGAELIEAVERDLLAMQVQARPLELVSARDASFRVLEELDAPPEAVFGVKTGIAPLDEQLGPLRGGDLVLLMGRPSMGKSAAAECIALNMAEAGWGVIQVNGEMSPGDMTQRHLSDIAQRIHGSQGPEYRDMRRRRITNAQRAMLQEAHEILAPLPISLVKRSGLKLSQLRSLARRQAAVWTRQGVPLGALIVDHVGLLHPDQSTRDRYSDQTIISNSLKELADELDCPVIGLNQMNRQNESREDKRPQLSDLRDSGSWEQDADLVIGFYREAYYAQRQPEPKKDLEWSEWDRARKSRVVEAIILKARAGACLTVNLWADVARNAIRGAPPEFGDLS